MPPAIALGLSHESTYLSPLLLNRSSHSAQRSLAHSCSELVFETVAVITTGFGFFNLGSRAPAQRAAGIKWLFRNFRSCRHNLHWPKSLIMKRLRPAHDRIGIADINTRFSACSTPIAVSAFINASYIGQEYCDGPMISRSNSRAASKSERASDTFASSGSL